MTISNTYNWLNQEKARYYTITVQKNNSENIVLSYSWGGLYSNRGGKKNISAKIYNQFLSRNTFRRAPYQAKG